MILLCGYHKIRIIIIINYMTSLHTLTLLVVNTEHYQNCFPGYIFCYDETFCSTIEVNNQKTVMS